MVATAHLIHGFIGAGKTTFARRLERELSVRRFTHDEWMVERHGHAPPVDQFTASLKEIDALIWKEALQSLEVGEDVILDMGFWSRSYREEARHKVLSAGGRPRFYSVQCPMELMRRRTLARSVNPPADSLWIDEPAFDKLLLQFEPMTDDEDFEEIDGTCLQT